MAPPEHARVPFGDEQIQVQVRNRPVPARHNRARAWLCRIL